MFLTNTGHTGRLVVTSMRTGKMYAIEPIGDPHVEWGDIDPATKTTTGSYGYKYRGAIDPDESTITEAGGFIKIKVLKAGMSPLKYIEELDSKYPDKL